MKTKLRLQGWAFCGLASILVAVNLCGVRLAAMHELLAAGVLISLLGMPHGAFDVVLARRLFGVVGLQGWAFFGLRYIGLAATVLGLWFAVPTFFLFAFLLFSALHFGGDLAPGAPTLTRCLYGGSVIVLPALWHGPELQGLLGLVTGPSSAGLAASVLGQLAGPWLAATALACLLQARTSRLAAFEMAALAALAVTAPPLVAFTTYFCAMHSPRHILLTLEGMTGAEARHALSLALWPTLATLAAMAVAGRLSRGQTLDAWVMQLVFVSLAALTLPHMVLLERVRRARQRVMG